MLKKLATALMFAILGTLPARAVTPDIASEALAEWLTLPAEIGGDVIVKSCSSCTTLAVGTTTETSFEIGRVPVRLDDLRRELASRPRDVLLLQLTPDRKNVARINIMPAAATR
jgi:hypothetical protein